MKRRVAITSDKFYGWLRELVLTFRPKGECCEGTFGTFKTDLPFVEEAGELVEFPGEGEEEGFSYYMFDYDKPISYVEYESCTGSKIFAAVSENSDLLVEYDNLGKTTTERIVGSLAHVFGFESEEFAKLIPVSEELRPEGEKYLREYLEERLPPGKRDSRHLNARHPSWYGKFRTPRNFRYQALLEEFPFIQEIVKEVPEEMFVKRMDETLLNTEFVEEVHDGHLVDYHKKFYVVAIMEDGTIIDDYKTAYSYQSNRHGVEPEYTLGETIAEWLDRKAVTANTKFVVVNEWGNDFMSGRDGRKWYTVTIYKLPKNVTIHELIEREKEKARRQVQREASF